MTCPWSTAPPRPSSPRSPPRRPPASPAGDHFAKPGANDRVWGALDKLAVADPAVFAEYYANDVIALISESWLGPDYQVTSQVNVVNPGGQAQTAHRDYHLGFMDAAAAARFPAQVHRLSPGADPAGRGRALRHARRDRPDPLPALLAPVRARLPRLPPARVHRVLPAELHPAAAGEGRCRVLQPRPVPRRRHERLDRRPTDGQPAAGVLAVRPRHGDRRPGRDVPGAVPGAAGAEGGRRVRAATWTTSSPRPPRATPSRPTSTGTSRSAASHPRPRPTWSARPSPRNGPRRRSSPPWTPRPPAPAPTTAEPPDAHGAARHLLDPRR